jgi:hypothetical protein
MSLIILRNSPLTTSVDEADFEYLSQFKWYAQQVGKTFRANTWVWCTSKQKHVVIKMHRMILDFPSQEIDHINRNGLDNQRANLRLSNRVQNNQNQVGHANSQLGIRGVTFDTSRQKFVAQYTYAGKKIIGKRFDTLEEAVKAVEHARAAYI